jgi:D-alanine-D-alanine ligase
LYGGRSGEHDVSLCSAASVVDALDRNKYEVTAIAIDRDGRWYVQDRPEIVPDRDFGRKLAIERKGTWLVNHFEQDRKLRLYDIEGGNQVEVDLVFPVIHGTYCEDGTIQGLMELAMVPYVGADVLGSAVGMDKDVAKRLLIQGGVPVVPWKTVLRIEWEKNREAVLSGALAMGLPLFVKPANTGSSVGIKKVMEKSGLREAVEFAFKYDNKILIEEGIDCREIECSVLGNHEPKASILGEVIPRHEFYSYEAKYIDSSGAELKIPAGLGEALSSKIRQTAVEAYRALCCTGMARVDFFLEKGSDRFYLNEINTIPGFTSISMYPKLWESTGLSYPDLLDALIGLALERHRARIAIRTDW